MCDPPEPYTDIHGPLLFLNPQVLFIQLHKTCYKFSKKTSSLATGGLIMDTSEICKTNLASKSHDAEDSWDIEFQEQLQTFPKEKNWIGQDLYLYQGSWYPSLLLKGIISFQQQFQAFDSDVFVATFPKCGTTWLKALTFSTLYRNRFARDSHPLRTSNPHRLVCFLDIDVYCNNRFPDLKNISPYKPRLFGAHVPYASLPTSVKDSYCKIVYICRNPMDMFISLWVFLDKLRDENVDLHLISLDEAFDKFCHGIHEVGPFFDHVLGYWRASQQNPNKILFLQYEDLKEDINSHLKKLAMFLGVHFTEEEEKQGVVEEIARVCSFENLKELEVNKNGFIAFGDTQETSSRQAETIDVQHRDLFRKGKAGDWTNYLTPSMAERMKNLHQLFSNWRLRIFTSKLGWKGNESRTSISF